MFFVATGLDKPPLSVGHWERIPGKDIPRRACGGGTKPRFPGS